MSRNNSSTIGGSALVVLFSLVLLLGYSDDRIFVGVDARKDHNQPHPHGGTLKPYTPGSFDVKLTRQDEQKLAAGQPVMKQSKDDPSGGGAICVQDVDAAKSVVWDQILDMNSYKGKVPKVATSKNYYEGKGKDGGNRFKTRMVIGVMPGYSYESYYDHTFYPKKDSMTWTLDYEKTSDFDDVSGHWHVEEIVPHAKTRVYYACDIKLHGGVPKPILNYISKSALKQATGWVKKESEKKAGPRTVAVPEKQLETAPEPVAFKPRGPRRIFGFFGSKQ